MRLAVLLALAPGLFAQSLQCVSTLYCEIRENTVASTGDLSIEGLRNGRVQVTGAERGDVRVRLRVDIEANAQVDTKQMFSRIRTEVTAGRVVVQGPDGGPGWTVSAEVVVPRATNLRLATNNGAITIADLAGNVNTSSHNAKILVDRIQGNLRAVSNNSEIRVTQVTGDADFETNNGAMLFSGIGGSVRGKTNNGHIELGLTGQGTAGRAVDLETHNAAVTITMPRDFSAEVLFESHHGQLKSDFPAPPRDKKANDDVRAFRIGSGAAKIHVRTNNGSVKLRAN